MNRREDGEDSSMLDLKLNLSPARVAGEMDSGSTSVSSSSEMSPEGSCVSEESMQCPSSPEETVVATMLLAGCPRCLMYVMLSESEPKCPRCKSSVLLDFLNQDSTTKKSRN